MPAARPWLVWVHVASVALMVFSADGQHAMQPADRAAVTWIDGGEDRLERQGGSRPRLLIAAERLHTLLATPAGSAAVAMLDDAGFLSIDPLDPEAAPGERGPTLMEAWGSLAVAIDLPADRAFERLLGRRLLVAVENPSAPLAGGWSLATLVEPGDVKRLFRALRPAQRGVVNGRAVFSIENGDYQLAVLGGGPWGDARLLLIAPSSREELFADMVGAFDDQDAAAWFTGAWPLVQPAGGLIARLRTNAGDRVTVSATAQGVVWTGRAVVPLVVDRPRGWPRALIRSVLSDSLVGLAGSIDPVGVERSPFVVMLGIRAGEITGLLGSARRRGVLLIDGGPDADGLALRCAIETAPGSVAAADTAARRLLGVITADPERAPSFGGAFPAATRSVPLRGPFADLLADRLIGAEPHAAWTVSEVDRTHAWLGLGLGPGGSAGERVRLLLEGVRPAVAGPVVSAGSVRPADLAGLRLPFSVDRRVRDVAGHVARATWLTMPAGRGRAAAEFEIRMNIDE